MRIIFLSLLLFTIAFAGRNEIKSQWRGPNRDGHYPENNLLKEWPTSGPQLIKLINGLGQGYSSPAITENKIFITGTINQTGYVFAYSHQGKLLWKKAYGQEWTANYPGSRCTPVIVDDVLYILTGHGVLHCITTEEGEKVWNVNILERFAAPEIQYGMSEQLLIDKDKIICTPGGAKACLAALDRFTGKTIWSTPGKNETSAYCSPILVNHNGIPLIITLLEKSMIGVNAYNGKLLWSFPHSAPWDIHANTPIYQNGYVYFQSGEGGSGALLKIASDANYVERIWESNTMDTLIGHQVLVDGYIYGAGYPRNGFQALDWNTGISKFEARQFSRCNVIYADGLIYAYSERGEAGLIRPDPDKFDLISSFKIEPGSGPHWAHPVINNRRLYLRHGDVLMIYNIQKK